MKSNTLRSAVALAVLALSTMTARADDTPLPPRVFSHPDRIRYDSECFTIEGNDTFIFSGAFHYFRCPKELWNDRFDKIKAAGFNTVETYVAWNKEEPAMPASPDDYSKIDLKDLDDWLSMAEAHGFYVILRPGPYICAEWNCGGFPQWLITKRPADFKGFWLRGDEPGFVAWSKHWFHAVDKVVVKHQLSHRKPGTGGIILYQLENEYGGNQPDDVEVRYLRALGQQTIDDGIDVPLFTCWTGVVRGSRDPILRQVYDSANFYPRWNVEGELKNGIAGLDQQQPDAPRQTTELQGGWFSNPGSESSLSQSWLDVIDSVSPAQIQNLTLYAIERGDRVTNYYMLFGGTNFGDMAPQGITTSYDYSAPIREIGSVGEKYQRVAAIGAMLKEHGQELSRAVPIGCEAKTENPDVTVAARFVSDEKGRGYGYLFFRTSQHEAQRKGTATIKITGDPAHGLKFMAFSSTIQVDYDLEAFGSSVYRVQLVGTGPDGVHGGGYDLGEWLPKPLPEMNRPTDGLPSPVKLTTAMTKADPGPTQWEPLKNGQTLEQMGIYDRRFVFYRTHFDNGLDKAIKDAPMLGIAGPTRDDLLTFVNGTYDPAVNHPGTKHLSRNGGGDHTIDFIYENVGQPNGGRGMEEMSGIRRIEPMVSDGTITQWKWTKLSKPEGGKFRPDHLKEIETDFADAVWTTAKIESDDDATQLAENQDGVFRAAVDITAEQLKTVGLNIQLTRMDDRGVVFINGKKVGEGDDWQSTYTFPAAGLHEGKNSVAVVVRNIGGRGGLGMVKLIKPEEKNTSLPIEIGTQSTGLAGQWWKNDLDETGWNQTPIGQPMADVTKLQWSRMKFDLPEVKKGLWVPWVARLHTNANGFLYLNGHALGRYWHQGPQHDFFLPECWLDFGSRKSNVLSMCLRSVDGKPLVLESAEIVPVNEVAEFRP